MSDTREIHQRPLLREIADLKFQLAEAQEDANATEVRVQKGIAQKLRDALRSAEIESLALQQKLSETREDLRLERGCGLSVKHLIVDTVGGLVEGRPTLTLNYLQRLRELVETEAAAEAENEALWEKVNAIEFMWLVNRPNEPITRAGLDGLWATLLKWYQRATAFAAFVAREATKPTPDTEHADGAESEGAGQRELGTVMQRTGPNLRPSSSGLKRLAQWNDRHNGQCSAEAWNDLMEVTMHMEREASND